MRFTHDSCSLDYKCYMSYIDAMASLNLRDIPAELRNKYKAVLAERGQNMKQDLIEHMKQTIESAKKRK